MDLNNIQDLKLVLGKLVVNPGAVGWDKMVSNPLKLAITLL